jgi:hypothetical protein
MKNYSDLRELGLPAALQAGVSAVKGPPLTSPPSRGRRREGVALTSLLQAYPSIHSVIVIFPLTLNNADYFFAVSGLAERSTLLPAAKSRFSPAESMRNLDRLSMCHSSG